MPEEITEKALAAPKPSRVIAELPTWKQLATVQGGLTPMAVSARMNDADTGRITGLVDLAHAMRQKDNHLQGILETRETAVQRLSWELELPRKPNRQEKKAARFVEDAIGAHLGPLVAHASSSPYFGFAVSETVWRKSSGYLVPDCTKAIHHRRFRFEGERLLWDDQNGAAAVDFQKLYPAQFVVSRPRVNGDVPCREGLMRVLIWAALFRNWSLTDWLRLGEIAWKPWRTGKYNRQHFATQEDIDGLVAILDAMSTSGTAVYPDSVEVDVKWPQGSSSASGQGPHSELFAVLGREMSKSTLGQTETTESSSSSGYAQSKTMNSIRKEKVESDATFIGTDLTRDFVVPLVLLNFGDRCRPPTLRAITEDAVDVASFATGVKTLRDAGTRIPAKWVRDKAGIPEPTPGEEILGPPEPAAPPEAPPTDAPPAADA